MLCVFSGTTNKDKADKPTGAGKRLHESCHENTSTPAKKNKKALLSTIFDQMQEQRAQMDSFQTQFLDIARERNNLLKELLKK